MINEYTLLTKKEIKLLEPLVGDFNNDEVSQFVYSKGFYDKDFFGDYFLSNWKGKKTPQFHKDIQKALDDDGNTCLICPRGHGKTTNILINIIHSLVYKTYGSQLYIASTGLGEESIGKIKIELETNALIKGIFGTLVPTQDAKTKLEAGAKKWRQKELQLLNGEGIETLSKGQSIRGKRPKRIIVDDLDENKDVMNKTIVEKTRTWFFTSLYNTLLPGGKMVILGTIVGNMCMVKYIKDTKDWNVLEYRAIMNGKALWKEQWSLEDLEERKKSIGATLFNQEFMNIPIQVENAVITSDQIKYFDYEGEMFDMITIGVDPAISEKTNSDSFAIVVTGTIANKKFVIEAKELNGKDKDPFKAVQIIKSLYSKYDANLVVIETVAFQQVMAKLLKAEGIATQEVSPHRDKVTRLLEQQVHFEQGNIFFNKSLTIDLVGQLLQFPDVAHDDLVDAMVYSLYGRKKKLIIGSL